MRTINVGFVIIIIQAAVTTAHVTPSLENVGRLKVASNDEIINSYRTVLSSN